MPNRTVRTLAAAALSAAALAVAVPAVAHADGTQDPAYSHPPTVNPPTSAPDEPGTAPLNERRAPLQQCPGGAANGEYSANPSYYPIALGKSGPTSFDLTFDTKGIPDQFDVLYEGKQVDTTHWRGDESANRKGHRLDGGRTGTLHVTLPPGRSDQIEIRVITDDVDTKWSFQVACPA